ARVIGAIDVALLTNRDCVERRAEQTDHDEYQDCFFQGTPTNDRTDYDSETHAQHHNVSGMVRQASPSALNSMFESSESFVMHSSIVIKCPTLKAEGSAK